MAEVKLAKLHSCTICVYFDSRPLNRKIRMMTKSIQACERQLSLTFRNIYLYRCNTHSTFILLLINSVVKEAICRWRNDKNCYTTSDNPRSSLDQGNKSAKMESHGTTLKGQVRVGLNSLSRRQGIFSQYSFYTCAFSRQRSHGT